MRRVSLRRYADTGRRHGHVSRMWSILSSIVRRTPVGQHRTSIFVRLRSVGAVRDEQSTAILSWLRPHLRPAARSSMSAAASGSFLKRARDMGCAVRGIEPDPDAAPARVSYWAKGSLSARSSMSTCRLDRRTSSPASTFSSMSRRRSMRRSRARSLPCSRAAAYGSSKYRYRGRIYRLSLLTTRRRQSAEC